MLTSRLQSSPHLTALLAGGKSLGDLVQGKTKRRPNESRASVFIPIYPLDESMYASMRTLSLDGQVAGYDVLDATTERWPGSKEGDMIVALLLRDVNLEMIDGASQPEQARLAMAGETPEMAVDRKLQEALERSLAYLGGADGGESLP